MTIYERPTKSLMTDWAKENLKPGQTFTKDDAARWFARHYPKIKGNTVNAHVEVMSINNHLRKHYPNIKPDSGHDLFYKLGPDEFRLWKQSGDPAPRYKQDLEEQASDDAKQRRQSPGPFRIRKVAAKILELARPFRPARTGNELSVANAIVLVSCVKGKLPHAAPARLLYTSTWFRKTRDIVEGSGARWFVLSSLYGMVAPDAVIAPYDYTLNTVGVTERQDWANKVLGKLLPEMAGVKRVVMFAGYRYREFLVEPLERRGIQVDVPMETLKRGEQLAWLSEHRLTK